MPLQAEVFFKMPEKKWGIAIVPFEYKISLKEIKKMVVLTPEMRQQIKEKPHLTDLIYRSTYFSQKKRREKEIPYINPPLQLVGKDQPIIRMGIAEQLQLQNQKLINFSKEHDMTYVSENGIHTIFIFKAKKRRINLKTHPEYEKKFTLFNMKPLTEIVEINFDYPQSSSDLKKMKFMGRVVSETYISDKERKHSRSYIHHHDEPLPSAFKYGKTIIICGGRMSVTDWIRG